MDDELGAPGEYDDGPAIGLPPLPVIEFGGRLHVSGCHALSCKYGPVARYAARRSLAWLDDDFDAYPVARDAFVEQRRAVGLSTELIGVNPRIGFAADHPTAVEAWARSLISSTSDIPPV